MQAINRLFKVTGDNFGRLDVLVNNAGTIGPGSAESLQDEVWGRIIDIHLTANVPMLPSCIFSS